MLVPAIDYKNDEKEVKPMIRKILFRAKRKEWKDSPKEQWWVEGHHLSIAEKAHMICGAETNCMATEWYEVDSETVGQYTNKCDDNNKPIYEDDFVIIGDDWIGRVIWKAEDTAFCVFPNDDINHETYCLGYYIEAGYKIKVIGNLFDNPELLEEG